MSQVKQGEIFVLTADGDGEAVFLCHMKALRDFDMNEAKKLFAGSKISAFDFRTPRPKITPFLAWLVTQEYAQLLSEFPTFWLGVGDTLYY